MEEKKNARKKCNEKTQGKNEEEKRQEKKTRERNIVPSEGYCGKKTKKKNANPRIKKTRGKNGEKNRNVFFSGSLDSGQGWPVFSSPVRVEIIAGPHNSAGSPRASQGNKGRGSVGVSGIRGKKKCAL